jgi:hypothetical protein
MKLIRNLAAGLALTFCCAIAFSQQPATKPAEARK